MVALLVAEFLLSEHEALGSFSDTGNYTKPRMAFVMWV